MYHSSSIQSMSQRCRMCMKRPLLKGKPKLGHHNHRQGDSQWSRIHISSESNSRGAAVEFVEVCLVVSGYRISTSLRVGQTMVLSTAEPTNYCFCLLCSRRILLGTASKRHLPTGLPLHHKFWYDLNANYLPIMESYSNSIWSLTQICFWCAGKRGKWKFLWSRHALKNIDIWWRLVLYSCKCCLPKIPYNPTEQGSPLHVDAVEAPAK